jgi:hypothetical protein
MRENVNLPALSTVRSATSTVSIGRTTVSEPRTNTSLAVPSTALRVRGDTSAETKGLLATSTAEGVTLSTVAILGATVTKDTALTSFTVLATAAVSRDITGSLIAGTKLSLAASLAMVLIATVAFLRTAVAVCAPLAGLAVLAAEAIGGDIAGLAVAGTELGLTACITVVLLVTTPAANGTAVTVRAALASLSIEASATTVA